MRIGFIGLGHMGAPIEMGMLAPYETLTGTPLRFAAEAAHGR